MISVWWIQLIKVLEYYVIRPGLSKHVMVTNTILVEIGYASTKCSLNNLLEITIAVFDLLWLFTWDTLSIVITISIQGRHLSLHITGHTTVLTGAVEWEVSITFNTSTGYNLW